jgi:cell shape-determining protein MreD
MTRVSKNFWRKILNIGPILLLYFLSISEIDTHFSNLFEILSFNLQLIVVFYWMLRGASLLGNSHIFFAGIINDVIMGLPMGISSLTYLTVSFVASYLAEVTVNRTLMTDWFSFFIALFCSNVIFLILISNLTSFTINFTEIFYNTFFTFLFYPIFWLIFNIYKTLMYIQNDA